ncbi:MAG TPA: permease prefix domain 1-containing protein [Terriglobia bacterium]|nr:permease prefix domain 1-containing protein [Terriglobia bacterium]
MKDEVRFHLEAKIDDLVTQGWRPEAARLEAERQFGDLRALQQIGAKHRRENGTSQTPQGLLE